MFFWEGGAPFGGLKGKYGGDPLLVGVWWETRNEASCQIYLCFVLVLNEIFRLVQWAKANGSGSL